MSKDFKIRCSPERINTVDKIYKLTNIFKIISGVDYEIINRLKELYAYILNNNIAAISSI